MLSLSFISSYVQELQSYLGVAFYLQPAIATVLLWRGHFPVTFRVPFASRNDHQDRRRCIERWTRLVTIRLPLHSMILFGWGVSLAKNLDLLPSFLVFCIGWFLLLTMEIARNRPSALYRPKSYVELMRVLILNQAGGPMSIKPDENLEQIMAFNEKQAELRKARDEVIKMIEMEQKMYETYIEAQTSCLEEEVDITTKARGDLSSFTLAPFRGLLLPLQQILHGICIILRVTKSVIVWRDSYVSFWIVTACFVASFILVWIPWAFLLSWTFKIIVWGLLGPWMKLLDIFYFRRIQSGEEQQKQDLAQKFRERYTMLIGESLFRKRRKETALKMKDMKKYMFGQVSRFGIETWTIFAPYRFSFPFSFF